MKKRSFGGKLLKAALLALAAAIFLASPSAFAADSRGGEVVVYNRSEYIPQDVLDKLTKETSIQVIYSTFESNESPHAKVKHLPVQSYDIVVPSGYFEDPMPPVQLAQDTYHSTQPHPPNPEPNQLNQ